MQAANADTKRKLADLLPLVRSFLANHPNSTVQEIAKGISRTPDDAKSACVVLEEIGEIKSTFRLKAKRRRKGA